MTTDKCECEVVDFGVGREIDHLLKPNAKKEGESSGKDEISDDGSYEFVGGDGTESDEVVVEIDHVGEGSGGDLKVVENGSVQDHNPSVDIATLKEGVDEGSENSSYEEEKRDQVEVPKIDSDVVVDLNKDGVRKGEVDDDDVASGVRFEKKLDDGEVLVEMLESDAVTVEVKETSELVASSVIDKINNDLIEKHVGIEDKRDYETTPTEVMGSGSSVIVHSDVVLPNNDISVNPHFPGEEIERGNESEEKCEIVSAHPSNDCVESGAERQERSHSHEEDLENRSVSTAMENVKVVEDGSKEMSLEDNPENASMHNIQVDQVDSVENEKDLACEAATPKSVKNSENILFVDNKNIILENSNKDISSSFEEIESSFETTHSPIKQWARDCDIIDGDNKVDIASTNTETLDFSNFGHNEEKQLVETQAIKTEINKDSDTDKSEIISTEGGSITGVNPNEVLTSKSEDTVSSSFPGQKNDSEPKHVCYLIKIPRFFNDNPTILKDLELQVVEKTKIRNALKPVLHSQKVVRDEYSKKLDAAKKEAKVARDIFNTKRQEIDAIQNTINKMKNASSIGEIDDTINKLEHRIQHETISLKEEKNLIREIKTLKQNRDRISSTLGPSDEVLEAYDQKNLIENRYENLQKEMNSLKREMIQLETNTKSIKKKYDDQCQVINDLFVQHITANNLQQQAYTNLKNAKREYHEKNTHFYGFKDDEKAANKFIASGDNHSLKHLCSDQVEKYMKLWNTNDEFRNHYVKFNMFSTVRRFKTVDGRCLGPYELPTVLPNIKRDNNRPSSINDSPIVSSESVTPEKVDLRVMNTPLDRPVKMQKHQEDNRQKSLKVIPPLGDVPNVIATVSIGESVTKLVENKKKKTEDDELTRKANEVSQQEEELKKEQAALKWKENIRLEQIAKAQLATERKKRQAEKAKARAEIKAQKNAELKEKKKAKKKSQKEKKLAGATDTELSVVETAKEPESIKVITSEKPAKALTKAPVTVRKQNNKLKYLPLPRRNKGKRKMQTWMLVALVTVLILVMILLGNYVSLSKFNLMPNLES